MSKISAIEQRIKNVIIDDSDYPDTCVKLIMVIMKEVLNTNLTEQKNTIINYQIDMGNDTVDFVFTEDQKRIIDIIHKEVLITLKNNI